MQANLTAARVVCSEYVVALMRITSGSTVAALTMWLQVRAANKWAAALAKVALPIMTIY